MTMNMHRGDGKRLKGSNKCSVWHRHTFMSPHVTMQPEGLRQNDGVFHIVAYPGRCRWATSVAALQAAFDGGVPHTQGVTLGYICSSPRAGCRCFAI